MPKPATPPTRRLIDSAVAIAPRLQPNVSASTGRNTPYAASGVEIPKVTTNSAATMPQRRADGRTRLFYHTPGRLPALARLDGRSGVYRTPNSHAHGRHQAYGAARTSH